MLTIISEHLICDLRVQRCWSERFQEEVWFLLDDGAEKDELGLSPVIAQGTREEVAARVRHEMEVAK
jgi:hypothetical protein